MNKRLIDAVVEQLGYDDLNEECLQTLGDVARHGANSGFSGFIYYFETSSFYARNQRLIVNYLQEESREMGMANALELVQSFRCAKGFDELEIAKALVTIDIDSKIANCLAWYALESVAYMVESMEDAA